MSKIPMVLLASIFIVSTICPQVMANGENVLAHTGQFTFFIKPDPESCKTYSQRMVPCVEKKTVPAVRLMNQTYPVPRPRTVIKPTLVTKTPMAGKGKPDCVQCFPKCGAERSAKRLVVPQMIPVTIPGAVIEPKCISKRIMKPVWFEFNERPAPPSRPTKVKYPRKVGPRG